MDSPRPLSFEDFQALLAGWLHLNVEQLQPEAYFVSTLGLDSLRLLQLMLKLEQLGGSLSLETAWQIQTVGDAYRHYRQALDAGHGQN